MSREDWLRDKIERLLYRWGDSSNLRKKIEEVSELGEIEKLQGDLQIMIEYERNKKEVSYFKDSGYFDEEMNPKGESIRGWNIKWKVREYKVPFKSNVGEGEVSMPLEDKPRYYKIEYNGVYSNMIDK